MSYKNIIKTLLNRLGYKIDVVQVVGEDPIPHRVSYAAYGEELLAQSWFEINGHQLKDLTYLDIGAAHPFHLSNTYLFYLYGAKGVLVEPDPDQVRVLKEKRPLDVVVSAGVSFDGSISKQNLYQMNLPFFNTFSEEQARMVCESSKTWASEHRVSLVREVEVPMIPINDIISQQFNGKSPDFLSIDVEAHDLDVLKSLDLGLYKPKIICIEGLNNIESYNELLVPIGYECIGTTPDNVLYKRFR